VTHGSDVTCRACHHHRLVSHRHHHDTPFRRHRNRRQRPWRAYHGTPPPPPPPPCCTSIIHPPSSPAFLGCIHRYRSPHRPSRQEPSAQEPQEYSVKRPAAPVAPGLPALSQSFSLQRRIAFGEPASLSHAPPGTTSSVSLGGASTTQRCSHQPYTARHIMSRPLHPCIPTPRRQVQKDIKSFPFSVIDRNGKVLAVFMHGGADCVDLSPNFMIARATSTSQTFSFHSRISASRTRAKPRTCRPKRCLPWCSRA
jgi:hypothetical protein